MNELDAVCEKVLTFINNYFHQTKNRKLTNHLKFLEK